MTTLRRVALRLLLSVPAFGTLPLTAASAQTAGDPRVLTRAEAIAEDAGIYAAQFHVTEAEARRRLRVQEASVQATDALADEFAVRLAGIAIEHSPDYRIVVLLTGNEAVADRALHLAGTQVPVTFTTGALVSHAQAVAAMRRHLIDLRSELPGERGAGYDQRTGEVVLLVPPDDAERLGIAAIRARAEQVSGVPVRVEVNALREGDMQVAGGGLIDGLNPADGRRYRCTSGFVVTDGVRAGIATAAHCPDDLVYRDQSGATVSLPFETQAGAGYQDVQVNVSPEPGRPLFYSDRKAGSLRRLTSWRNRASTRAGDFVCHWGESSGYSCGQVALTDYAPPGPLCGGPCEPTWVTVPGPSCMAGDSGGPVFSGTTAFGIAKGINRTPDGRCNFYYYMSTDYLPPPWRLLVSAAGTAGRRADPAGH